MSNLFEGFRRFAEDKAPGYLNTIKKQERVPKKLWYGMPLMIGANKRINLDGKVFTGPMTFYVTEFDNAVVTMKLVRNPMDFSNMDDPDDEIDLDNNFDDGEQKFTIPRAVFEKLLEPDNEPGADFAGASQTAMAPR
jgi:hypothetical protein